MFRGSGEDVQSEAFDGDQEPCTQQETYPGPSMLLAQPAELAVAF